MNQTSIATPHGEDEFALAGLTAASSRLICAPRVGESPVPCATGTSTDTWLSLGELVGINLARHLMHEGIYDTAAAQPVLRSGRLLCIEPNQLLRMTG
jgi:flavin reductase (DIM6/NTAB) family NADH-FMN oxidoreductase RutF